jgi:hypothetical protein
MLTVGGTRYFNASQTCDWESKGVAIYDLPTLTWGSTFNENPGSYAVPGPVSQAIGGSCVCSRSKNNLLTDLGEVAQLP